MLCSRLPPWPYSNLPPKKEPGERKKLSHKITKDKRSIVRPNRFNRNLRPYFRLTEFPAIWALFFGSLDFWFFGSLAVVHAFCISLYFRAKFLLSSSLLDLPAIPFASAPHPDSPFHMQIELHRRPPSSL